MTEKLTAYLRALSSSPKGLLSPLDKQRLFIASKAAAPMPCPVCGEGVCRYDAAIAYGAIDNPEAWVIGSHPADQYRCLHCDTPLFHNILLFGGQEFWTIGAPVGGLPSSKKD